ncbi:pirin family protein [Neisseria iguanae]|uniref:Short-chain dehydrogenase n=1 Tax=Neisseria iguanae TaxID=90242 RepID=A0A2P7TWZ7_9NEIS|nr:pirin family protein [Neisseria iguanae]PSJ79227.1 short-chain dehydrogenase [Neisseria iguanae]
MRTIRQIYPAPPKHWVGDGFHVSPLFSHMDEVCKHTSPFLMLDYGMPTEFAPNSGTPRGVGSHPHAGFETVTVVLQGEVAHRDSSGSGGIIREGGVQWMTAGRGIIHEEYHSKDFSERGGVLEELQFWVNLPRKFKEIAPEYQALPKEKIPVVRQGDAKVSVIAGELNNIKGAARTFSEINLWILDLPVQGRAEFDLPANHNVMLVILRGNVSINGRMAKPTELVTFEVENGRIGLQAQDEPVKLALCGGIPIDEPVVGYGPFVMNTHEEILEKIRAFKAGKFGLLD